MKDPKLEVEQLVKEYLIMLYGKKPFYKKSDYFKVKQVVLLCVSKQFELLRYLGGKDNSQLYDYLVEQKKEIQNL
tara:strand:+ start:40546 stop:40770 length:225 start_codon:yes stop_codon:yes gene_type:complete